jgi:hypothetical protein
LSMCLRITPRKRTILEFSSNVMYHLLYVLVTMHFGHIVHVCLPMCVVWFSLQTAIISLNSVNRLIFVTVKCCVFFAVRDELINII